MTETIETIRINEIARENDLPNKDLVAAAQAFGLEAKSHSSKVPAASVADLVAAVNANIEADEGAITMTPIGKVTRKNEAPKAESTPKLPKGVTVPKSVPAAAESAPWGEGQYAGENDFDRVRSSLTAQTLYAQYMTGDAEITVDLSAELTDMGVDAEMVGAAANRVRNRFIKGGYFQEEYPEIRQDKVFGCRRDGMALTMTHVDVHGRVPRLFNARGALTKGPGQAALEIILNSKIDRGDFRNGTQGDRSFAKRLAELFNGPSGLGGTDEMLAFIKAAGLTAVAEVEAA